MSSNLKQTRGISHKKKQTLVATIIIDSAVIAKKARLLKLPNRSMLSSTNHVIIDINDEDNNECTVTPTAVVAISSPSSSHKK